MFLKSNLFIEEMNATFGELIYFSKRKYFIYKFYPIEKHKQLQFFQNPSSVLNLLQQSVSIILCFNFKLPFCYYYLAFCYLAYSTLLLLALSYCFSYFSSVFYLFDLLQSVQLLLLLAT